MLRRAVVLSALPIALLLAIGPAHAQQCPTSPTLGAAIPGPLPVLPWDNWWNTDIRTAPVDRDSLAYLNYVGLSRRLHPDFGGEEFPGSQSVYGFPYIVLTGDATPKQAVTFQYWDESDGVNMSTHAGVPFYPIPSNVATQAHWMEGGAPGNIDQRNSNDRHILIFDCPNRTLYELYNAWFSTAQQRWYAGSGAFFDLKTNARRPEGWTSADAAGLAIFPGLVRYDEAANPNVPEINHALRVTVRASNGHVFPASHTAGSTSGALPMGARLRLKSFVNGVDPVTRTTDPTARKIFRAMQKYGLIVADNGSDMYISGTFDTRWNNDALNPAFNALQASDFEVIQLGWQPVRTPVLSIDDASVLEGNAGTTTLRFTVRLAAAATSTVSVSYATSNGTATAGSDYAAASGSLSFAPGQLARTFDVVVYGEKVREPNETLQVTLSNAAGAPVADAVAIGTILSDDSVRTGGNGQADVAGSGTAAAASMPLPYPAPSLPTWVSNIPFAKVGFWSESWYPRYPW